MSADTVNDLNDRVQVGYTIGPVLFYSIALWWLIWSYPLTPLRHVRMRKRVEQRNRRLTLTSS